MMNSTPGVTRLLTTAAAACALICTVPLAAQAAGAAPAGPAARAAATCDIDKVSRSLGPTYVTSLTVTKATCSEGISLVRAFHQCRMAKGKKGRCTKPVQGYRCAETRNGIKTQFSGRVTCSKGSKRVEHTYTQFT